MTLEDHKLPYAPYVAYPIALCVCIMESIIRIRIG